MNHAVALCRKSTTDRQELSLEGQKREIEDYARQNALEIVRCYEIEETGYSAGDAMRYRRKFEEFKHSLFDLAEGFQELKLLVWSTDRLGRIEPDEFAHFHWECRLRNIRIVFVTEQEASAEGLGGSVLRLVKFSQAKEFSEKLGLQVKRGKCDHALQGAQKNICFALGGADVFGYRRAMCDGDGNFVDANGRCAEQPFILEKKFWNANPRLRSRYVVQEEEANVVQRIFRMRLDGMGALRIAKALNQEGIRPPRAQKWSKRSVQNILTNRIYSGYFCFNRRCTGKTLKGKLVFSDVVTIHDPSIAIMSEEDFDRVRLMAASRRTTSGASSAGRPSTYEFAKKIFCGECGSVYTDRRYGDRPVYVCSGKRYRGICASQNDLDGANLLEVFSSLARQKLEEMSTEENLGKIVGEINKALGDSTPFVDVSVLEKSIAMQRLKLQALFKGDLTPELQRIFEAEKAVLISLEKKQDELLKARSIWARRVDISTVRAFVKSVRLTGQDIRQIIDKMLHSIVVCGKNALINFYAAPSEIVIDGMRVAQATGGVKWATAFS